jgi:HSP20 family protein
VFLNEGGNDMLLRFDPFRDFDRLFEGAAAGSATSPRTFPMNAVRRGDKLVVSFDLPGVRRDDIDLTVERNQLTVSAERSHDQQEGDEWFVAERPVGRFSRQLMLGDNLDYDHIDAEFRDGVLEIMIPVAEQAKARKVEIGGSSKAEAIETSSSTSSQGEGSSTAAA